MKCRRCGEPVYPGNAYCQTCSDAMTRRSQELEAAATERSLKPQKVESSLVKVVIWVTLIGAIFSISPYVFFRAQERVQSAGKALDNLTEKRTQPETAHLAQNAQPSLAIGRAQRTASLESAMQSGGDGDGDGSPDVTGKQPLAQVNHFPKPISAWVDELAANERKRQTLAVSQLATYAHDGDETGALAEDFENQWIAFLKDFEKASPPKGCEELAAAYSRVLRETAASVMLKVRSPKDMAHFVADGIRSGNESVLVAPAEDADQLYHDLCSRYGSSKDFEIVAQLSVPRPHP